jgi:myo-inositol 2-dehydrogenase/D-chiro-inositol 1-dehydrogenase
VIAQTLAAYEHHQVVKITGSAGALWASWSGAMDRTLHPTFSLRKFDGESVVEIPITQTPGEVYELGRAGLPAMEAIVAGTSGAAESIGVADSAGLLAQGRQADVVAIAGNPLDDLRALWAIRDVWQAGRRLERTEV